MVSFDQYQRYATIGRIVSLFCNDRNDSKRLKILEVGSNAQRNLEKFVDAEIFYTDIVEIDEFKDDDHFFVADATNLEGIKDNEFDIVVASDVFEHIPVELREDFLSELNRVAKEYAIVCFPYSKDIINDVEKRVNSYYKTIYGEDYQWLNEHIYNGLPELDLINKYLDACKIYYSSCGHGSIDIWEEMMKAHFYAAGVTELIDYRVNIDRLYEEYVYKYDVSEDNYRMFYMLTKSEDNKKAADKIMSELFCDNPDTRIAGYEKIKLLCNDLHNIYFAKVQRNVKKKDLDIVTSYYYDSGNGYLEDNRVILQPASPDEYNEYVLSDLHEKKAVELRFDFVEKYMCEVIDLVVREKSGDELKFYSNATEQYDNTLIFKSVDPQMTIVLPENVDMVIISFYLDVKDNMAKKKALLNKCDILARMDRINKKLDNAHSDIDNVNLELMAMEDRCNHLQYDYDMVIRSTSWKMTAPVRYISDAFHHSKVIDYSSEFVRGIFRDGIRHTLHRVKNKIIKTEKPKYYNYNIEIEPVEENILFSILVPLYNTDITCLKELLDSIIAQTYTNWELCLGDASTENIDAIKDICTEYQSRDPRIRYFRIKHNNGISENTNECARMAKGDYLVLCDHDDIIAKEALQANAWMIQNTGADVLYSDEDHIDMQGNHFVPLFKPDWSPDLLHSQMYVCHLFVFRKSLFEEAGGLNKEYDGSQDYDLMLRYSEMTRNIVHIPLVLYSWREIETSTAANADAKPYADEAGRRALDAHLKRVYGNDAYAVSTEHTFLFSANYGMTKKMKPLVSIIIPMKDQYKLSKQCVESIIRKTSYSKYEIIILNNRSEQHATLQWLNRVERDYKQVRVINADFEFNWSKLNNYGIENAKGDVFVFMNNDTLVISEDWLDILCDNALRDDVGVVGPMLLYRDGSLQHAGIIVGMGGWADHLFKEMMPVHYSSPYVSPVVSRNVLAVTGACMAISRKTIEDIGVFDDEFIICGSDVEICIRAYEHGLNNVYCANSKLYHLESKSRDSFIPEIDFKKSYECYGIYREYGDPYYNINLDINSVRPREGEPVDWTKVKNHLRANRFTAGMYENLKKKLIEPSAAAQSAVAEVQEIRARKVSLQDNALRINIIVPSVDIKHVFGGISTALAFFEKLTSGFECLRRIIVTDAPVFKETMVELPEYYISDASDDTCKNCQIIPFSDRADKTIAVSENDIFVATGWWTAYTIADVIRWQEDTYNVKNPLIYMVQDYEPGFYPWSSRYMMADSTYRLEIPTIVVINSEELKDFFDANGYSFYRSFCYRPVLNNKLKEYLLELTKKAQGKRKKQVLIYGRPGVERNAFALIVDSLKRWVQLQEDIGEWSIISAGEAFEDIDLGRGKVLHSIGKVSLKEYAEIMYETKAAISLMVSPHPSYPPLEMSTFGVKVITNCYGNKDLSDFNENIISMTNCSSKEISVRLHELCNGEDGKCMLDSDYVKVADSMQWESVVKEIRILLTSWSNRK